MQNSTRLSSTTSTRSDAISAQNARRLSGHSRANASRSTQCLEKIVLARMAEDVSLPTTPSRYEPRLRETINLARSATITPRPGEAPGLASICAPSMFFWPSSSQLIHAHLPFLLVFTQPSASCGQCSTRCGCCNKQSIIRMLDSARVSLITSKMGDDTTLPHKHRTSKLAFQASSLRFKHSISELVTAVYAQPASSRLS
jgi:hypothetical protein